jgi:hypothetical protein
VRVICLQANFSLILGSLFHWLHCLTYKLLKEVFNAEASPLFEHPELKFGVLPRLYYAVLILHRVIYAVAVVCLNTLVVRLSILTVSTFLVTSTLTLYLALSVLTQVRHTGTSLREYLGSEPLLPLPSAERDWSFQQVSRRRSGYFKTHDHCAHSPRSVNVISAVEH